MNLESQQCNMTTLPGQPVKKDLLYSGKITDPGSYGLRIIRSPWAKFAENEVELALGTYTEEHLSEIASEGFNAIWIRVLLRNIVPSSLFPDIGANGHKQLTALKELVSRSASFGLKIFLYLCEPRGFRADDPFWDTHSHLKGQPVDFEFSQPGTELYHALCTSTPEVKAYLEESTYNLFSAVPDLGGLFCITASEFHTHCYSHFPGDWQQFSDPNVKFWKKGGFQCPRCADRTPADVVSEVITLLNRGTKRASSAAEVIAWTWSWSIIEESPQHNVINLLPTDVIVMSDFERGGLKSICGGALHEVEEYSFSHVPPSDRFRTHADICERTGRRFMAKLQLSTTHELASVPYIPVPFLLAEKFESLREMQVHGYLGCWVMGGYLSPMTRLATLMSRPSGPCADETVRELASKEFGNKHCRVVSDAWQHFSKAWLEYPFSIHFLYYGPMNYATAYILTHNGDPQIITSCLPLPRDVDGRLSFTTDVQTWVQPFGAETTVNALKNLLAKWLTGLTLLEDAKEQDRGSKRLATEWGLAKHIALTVQSTINIISFHVLSGKLLQNAGAKKDTLKKQIHEIILNELDIVKQDRELVLADNRLGYHSEAGCHLYTAQDLDYKIRMLTSESEKLNT